MAIDFLTPAQIADNYLLWLKGLRPNINTEQTDSDWWIRAQVIGGVTSGIYADQRLIANDAFPQRARREAVGRALELWLDDTFRSPTQAEGDALVTGASGSSVPANTQFLFALTGNVYQSTDAVDFDGETAILVPIISVNGGQDQNLLSGAALVISSPPPGVDANASASGNIADGRNEETTAEGSARVLARIREPISGGTASDYEQWAVEADPAVVSANVIRFYDGLGTVGVVIAAGTTDIDEALNNNEPVVLIPSEELIERVQEYISERVPLTDCAIVLAPTGVDVDVTVRVVLQSGNLDSIPAGQTLTQEELVQREVKRAIYKTKAGGRQLGASGFLVASDIEETIDVGLSAEPTVTGLIPILLDRQVLDLSDSGPNYPLLSVQLAQPGTITVEEM